MSRTVISVHPTEAEDEHIFFLDEAPATHSGAGTCKKLKLSGADKAFERLRLNPLQLGAVESAGRAIYEALKAHGAVGEALKDALKADRADPNNQERPIFLELNSPNAENIPWETLWAEPVRFLALDDDKRWPLGRLTTTTVPIREIRRNAEPRLKITAILAAAGVDPVEEWNSLFDSLDPLGNNVHLQVLVSRDELRDLVNQKIQQAPDKISVAFVGDRRNLLLKIVGFGPNVVHFFCHGNATDRPHLEIENRTDYIRSRTTGSVLLEVAELKELARLDTLWLVTLNCCRGASPSASIQSLASSLVREGLPAVVGMREAVDVADANLFTRSFYEALLGQLMPILAQHAAGAKSILVPQTIWAAALHAPREQLVHQQLGGRLHVEAAASTLAWTLPVLYAHQAKLLLSSLGNERVLDESKRVELRTYLSLFKVQRTLAEVQQTPPEQLVLLDNKIRDVEAQLYEPI
jgi:hypothetical protein